ncbi:hypothetical protein NIES4074_29720 [Cylindrospermum sp. NIES-4074]|nr:hypothetical protein NIES4074_29720 [Cylindrospermum sp. NIES-4074]
MVSGNCVAMGIFHHRSKIYGTDNISDRDATIFLTKALEKSGENFSDSLTKIVNDALTKIRKPSPETAEA